MRFKYFHVLKSASERFRPYGALCKLASLIEPNQEVFEPGNKLVGSSHKPAAFFMSKLQATGVMPGLPTGQASP